MADLVTKLLPILRVPDLDAERRFYESFGLRTTYAGEEFPDFIAVGNDSVEFGLTKGAGEDSAAFQWQLGVGDVDAVVEICEISGWTYKVEVEQPGDGWLYRVVKVVAPSGAEVWFEGERE